MPPGGATATPGCLVPQSVRIAVVGDYGMCTEDPTHCEAEAAVAYYVRAANPDFVITVGDDNYTHGDSGPPQHPPPHGGRPAHIANNNSRVFRLADFPTPYATLGPPSTPGTPAAAGFPPSPPTLPPPPTPSSGIELYQYFLDSGRFFTALGNHDWHQSGASPAKTYFGQAGESGESHPAGPVEVFVVDTNQVGKRNDDRDRNVQDPPDLLGQAPAVATALHHSAACWKILYMHHPMHSLGLQAHKKVDPLVREFATAVAAQAPNQVDAVLSGHLHAFEYLTVPGDGAEYFLVGTSGAEIQPLARRPEPPAVRRYGKHDKKHHGFLLIDVTTGQGGTPSQISYAYHAVEKIQDLITPTPGGPPTPTPEYWYQRWSSWSKLIHTELRMHLTLLPTGCSRWS